MAVYVDPNMAWPPSKKWPFKSVSHMYADSVAELHTMAKRLGLKRIWCSDHTQPNSDLLHYDLNASKRAQAVRFGAIETSHEHMVAHKQRNPRKVLSKDLPPQDGDDVPVDPAMPEGVKWGQLFGRKPKRKT